MFARGGLEARWSQKGGRNTWMGVVVITHPGELLNFVFFFFLSFFSLFALKCAILTLGKWDEVRQQTVVCVWRAAVVLFLTPWCLVRLALSPWIRSFLPPNEYFWVVQDVFADTHFFFFFLIFRSSNGVRSLPVSHGIAWDVLFVDNSLEGLKLLNREPSMRVSSRLFLRVSFSKGTVSPLTSVTRLYLVPGFEQTWASYGSGGHVKFFNPAYQTRRQLVLSKK